LNSKPPCFATTSISSDRACKRSMESAPAVDRPRRSDISETMRLLDAFR
jgi:hypothetical protein